MKLRLHLASLESFWEVWWIP